MSRGAVVRCGSCDDGTMISHRALLTLIVAVVGAGGGCGNSDKTVDASSAGDAAAGCPFDISGTWTQSYICYDNVPNTCERDDSSTYTITMVSCANIASDMFTTFTGTLSGTGPGATVTWSGDEDTDPEGPTMFDYHEAGTW